MVRVLLVDDDRDVLDTVGDWLRHSYEVRLAEGLPQAILALAEGPLPDVVITDLQMPPYSGEDLLAVLAARYPKICRILHTGSGELPRDSYAQHVIAKGGDIEELEEVIRRCAPGRKSA